jgi:hypothetical protein
LVVGLTLMQLPAAARELTEFETEVKDRMVELGQGQGSVEKVRIELMDGSGMMPGLRIYEIANGQVLGQVWGEPGSAVDRREGTASEAQVRELLRTLVEQQFWNFEGTAFVPDAPMFLFRLQMPGLPPMDYRCDKTEYEASPERLAIRATLLTFVGEDPKR